MIYAPKDLLVTQIEKYCLACSEHEDAYKIAYDDYRRNIGNGKYTHEHSARLLQQAREQADNQFSDIATQLHQHYNTAFATFSNSVVFAVSPRRAEDHASRVNVALQLLQIEKGNLSDQRAASILREFIESHDFEDLEAFHRVIELQTNGSRDENGNIRQMVDAHGNTTWSKTFTSLDHWRKLSEKIQEAQNIANEIFIDTRTVRNYGTSYNRELEPYLLPASGYRQMFIEKTYPEQLDELQAMLNEFFTVDVPLS